MGLCICLVYYQLYYNTVQYINRLSMSKYTGSALCIGTRSALYHILVLILCCSILLDIPSMVEYVSHLYDWAVHILHKYPALQEDVRTFVSKDDISYILQYLAKVFMFISAILLICDMMML